MIVTCLELAQLIARYPDRVAVLILLRDKPEGGSSIQIVTYGKAAEDKVEAHQIKEWIKRDVFSGDPPPSIIHESFILDAAKNRELVDQLQAEVRRLQGVIDERLGTDL